MTEEGIHDCGDRPETSRRKWQQALAPANDVARRRPSHDDPIARDLAR
jgi:hypothetical protein